MILKREEEIRKFVPKEYYSIDISTKKGSSNFKMNWIDKKNNTTSFNEEKINLLISSFIFSETLHSL